MKTFFIVCLFPIICFAVTGQLILDNVQFNGNFGGGNESSFLTSPAYTITEDNKNNWNTSYSWGNHSTQGYLTSESLFLSSPAYTITYSLMDNWNNSLLASIAYTNNVNTTMKAYVDNSFQINQNSSLGVSSFHVSGATNSNNATIKLYNHSNAASMMGTGGALEFYQNYYDASNPQPVLAGNIQYTTAGNWTATGSTQTTNFKIRRRISGVFQNVMEEDTNTLRFPNVYAFRFGGTDSSSFPYASLHVSPPWISSQPSYLQSAAGLLINTFILTTDTYRMYNDFVSATTSTGTSGGGLFRFFTQPRSTGNPVLAMTIDENQQTIFSNNVNIAGSLTVGGYLINPAAGINMNNVNLTSLADVQVSGVEENQVLKWNGSKWINGAVEACNCNFYTFNSNLNSIATLYINDAPIFKTNQYLSENDFPDSVNSNGNIYIFKAGNSSFDTTYGGISLISAGSLSYEIDRLGNSEMVNVNAGYMYFDTATMAGSGTVSIFASIKKASWQAPATNHAIVSDWNGSDGSWSLEHNTSGEIAFYMITSSTKTKLASYKVTNLDPSLWHTINHVFSPASFSALYIDGVLVAISYHTINPPSDPSYFQISGIAGNNYLFDGLISEVALHKYAHTSSDILKIVSRGSKTLLASDSNGYPIVSKYNDEIIYKLESEAIQGSPAAGTEYEVNSSFRIPLRKGVWHVTLSGTNYFNLNSSGQGYSLLRLLSADSSVQSGTVTTAFQDYSVAGTGYTPVSLDLGNVTVPSDMVFRVMTSWIIKSGSPSALGIGLDGSRAPLVIRAAKVNE